MMFAFIGSAALYVATDVLTVGGTLPPNVVMAALANGLMLAVASERLRHQLCSPRDSPFVHRLHGHALLAVHHHTRACSMMCHSRLPHLFSAMCIKPCVSIQCAAVFATANISGGHITPTVTIATMITGGHM
jgi:Major intrinsic protein